MLNRAQVTKLRRAPLLDTPNKIALAMKLADVTQVEVAAGVGLTQASVSRIRNGHYEDLPFGTVQSFAHYFGCSIEDLFPSREALSA
jgi:transcriptional regulator with XRE-family HTH domain